VADFAGLVRQHEAMVFGLALNFRSGCRWPDINN
jgi:hypothetical protein